MGTVAKKIGFSIKAQTEFEQTEQALQKVNVQIIAETKARNSYLVIADDKGNIKKIPAKDL